MGFFPKVSSILSGLDRQGVSERGDVWDKQVAQAIIDFGASYGGSNLLQRNRKLIDYGDLAAQTAYVFMYVAGHADFLSQVMAKGLAAGAADIFQRDALTVTSLGGGPGSDLLALVDLVRSLPAEGRPRQIRYRVLDKQPNWHEILKTVSESQRGTLDIELVFEEVDVTIPALWQSVTCKDDHLLIMNFFVSEVCKLREANSVRQCLENVLATLRSGSVFVFNDSSFPSCYEYMDARSSAAGGFRRLVAENARLDATPDFDEFFRDCLVRFERTPKLGSNAAYRVLRRQ